MNIEELKRRAGIVNEQGQVTGVTGRGTDPLAQLDTETFLQIINTTLEELGQLRPQSMNEQQKIQLARRVVQRFRGGTAGEQDTAGEQAQADAAQANMAGHGTPQAAGAAGDPLA